MAEASGASSSPSASSSADKSVTFLFKYAVGACPKSYGLNVARLARLPESVVRRAAEKSEAFELAVAEAEREAADAAATAGAAGAQLPASRTAQLAALGNSAVAALAASGGGGGGRSGMTVDGDDAGGGAAMDELFALACRVRGRA